MPIVAKRIEEQFSLGLWKIDEEIPFFESSITYRSSASSKERIKQQLAARMALDSIHENFPFDLVCLSETGKPMLKDQKIKFSLSHCNGYAAAIASGIHDVGIDIEPIHQRVLKVEKKFLHENELNLLVHHKDEKRIEYLTLLWSLKESLYKWWGKGGVDFSNEMKVLSFEESTNGKAIMHFSKLPEEQFELQYFLHDQVWVTMLCK